MKQNLYWWYLKEQFMHQLRLPLEIGVELKDIGVDLYYVFLKLFAFLLLPLSPVLAYIAYWGNKKVKEEE